MRQYSSCDWSQVDQYALATPDNLTRSASSLGQYLGQAGESDAEKARSVFRWIAENIKIDLKSLGKPILSPLRIDAILARRETVFEGYGRLFVALAKYAGLQVKQTSRTAYIDMQSWFLEYYETHVWNAVKISDEWYLLDYTYVSNAFKINDKWVLQDVSHMSNTSMTEQEWNPMTQSDEYISILNSKQNSYWLYFSQEAIVFSHHPFFRHWLVFSNAWQCLSSTISMDTFRNSPTIGNLYRLGSSAKTLLQAAQHAVINQMPIVAPEQHQNSNTYPFLESTTGGPLVSHTIGWSTKETISHYHQKHQGSTGLLLPNSGDLFFAIQPEPISIIANILEYYTCAYALFSKPQKGRIEYRLSDHLAGKHVQLQY